MSRDDSVGVLALEHVRFDTARFFTTDAYRRRVSVDKAVAKVFTLNMWSADSLTDTLRWQIADVLGGMGFVAAPRGAHYEGYARTWGDMDDSERRVGRVVARAVTCEDSTFGIP
jgi:hypothetical protein